MPPNPESKSRLEEIPGTFKSMGDALEALRKMPTPKEVERSRRAERKKIAKLADGGRKSRNQRATEAEEESEPVVSIRPEPAKLPENPESPAERPGTGPKVEPTEAEKEEQESAQETVESINPFQERENEIVRSITEKYAKETKISAEAKKAIDGFLVRDTEEAYKDFAVKWFKNNEGKMEEAGRVIPPDASNEWIVNMVLRSPEKGGMGASAEINNPEYKDVRAGMDKIGILRADMRKDQIPPETPFLMLNYLQKKFENGQEELAVLKAEAKAGDKNAEILAISKEKDLKERFQVIKELAEKAANEDLTEEAKKAVGDRLPSKDGWVKGELDEKKEKVRQEKNGKLIDAEWQEYKNLDDKKKEKYQKKLKLEKSGFKLEMSRADFDVMTKDKGYTPRQAEEEYEKNNRYMFHSAMLKLAKNNRIEGDAFYGMLSQGYKPYEKQKLKGFWTQKIIISQKGGILKEVPEEGYNDFVKNIGGDYAREIALQAQKELEALWDNVDKEYDGKVSSEIGKRIKEIALSPEKANDGIERIYKEARDRIEGELRERTVKDRKEKTPAEQKKIDKEFGDNGKSEKAGKKEKIKSPLEFISDATKDDNGERRGGLENLTGDLEEDARDLSRYFHSIGVEEMTPAKLKKTLKGADHQKAYKEQWGRKRGLVEWFFELLKDKPWR